MPSYPAITEAHNAPLSGDNLYNLAINYKWRRLAAEMLQPLANSSFWSGSEADIEDAVFNAAILIEDLYTAEATMTTEFAHAFFELAPGTNAGSSVAGWQKLTFNGVEYINQSAIAIDLSTQQIVVQAGTYHARARSTAHRVGVSQLKLREPDDLITYGLSTISYSDSSILVNISPTLETFFSVGTETHLELWQFTNLARASNGLGVSVVSTGEAARYREVFIEKIS